MYSIEIWKFFCHKENKSWEINLCKLEPPKSVVLTIKRLWIFIFVKLCNFARFNYTVKKFPQFISLSGRKILRFLHCALERQRSIALLTQFQVIGKQLQYLHVALFSNVHHTQIPQCHDHCLDNYSCGVRGPMITFEWPWPTCGNHWLLMFHLGLAMQCVNLST